MSGFRNILVYDYMTMYRQVVYRNLRQGLKDLAERKKVVVNKVLDR